MLGYSIVGSSITPDRAGVKCCPRIRRVIPNAPAWRDGRAEARPPQPYGFIACNTPVSTGIPGPMDEVMYADLMNAPFTASGRCCITESIKTVRLSIRMSVSKERLPNCP